MRFLLVTLVLACAAASAGAQTLDINKVGGAFPGTTTIRLQGAPGTSYVLLFSLFEQETPIGPLTLQIPVTSITAAPFLPGFLGALDGTGRADAGFALPDEPVLATLVISFQAVGYSPEPLIASNLLRVTPQAPGTFAAALDNPMLPILGGAVATQADGSLVFCGGSGPVAQTYDPRLEHFALGGASFGVGALSQSTGLNDGRILFTGGLGLDGQPTTAAAVYDPVTQQTITLAMGQPRAGHAAALLGNGKVLVSGGFRTFNLTDPLLFLQGVQNTSELFDPTNNSFTPGANMLEARGLHTATSLQNGNVLVGGGLAVIPILNIPYVSNTAYIFNATSNSFGLPRTFTGGRMFHTATRLPNGRVLMTGGITLDLTVFLQTLNPLDIIIATLTDAVLFNPSGLGTFSTVPGMSDGRAGAALAALPDGGAVVVGGVKVTFNNQQQIFEAVTLQTADRYSTTTNGFSATGAPRAARVGALAVPLPDGTVLIVGGGPTDAEVYQP